MKFTDADKIEVNGQKVVPVGIYVGRGQGSAPVLFKDTLFITTSTPQGLNNKHTIFGEVVSGYETVVKPALDKPLRETTCIACGNCIEVCPTGAITFHATLDKPGPFRTVPHRSVCSFCGVGCEIDVNHTGRDFFFVTAKPTDPFTEGELCAKGRFGYHFINHDLGRLSLNLSG